MSTASANGLSSGAESGGETGASAAPLAPEKAEKQRKHDEKVHRAQSTQQYEDPAEIARQRRESDDRFKRIEDQLKKIMTGATQPAAAVSSSSPQRSEYEKTRDNDPLLRELTRTIQKDGSTGYALPVKLGGGLEFTGRPSFVEHGPGVDGRASHIEIFDTSEKSLKASMLLAKAKWGEDAILIHAKDREAERMVKIAVENGIVIANKDPHIFEMVKRETERQKNPLLKDRKTDRPLLERVPREMGERTL